MNYGLKSPKICVSLRQLKSLKEIEFGENEISIGSMVSLAFLAENKFLKKTFPALVSAAIRVASPQIRNMATLGGNILQERRCKYFNHSERWREGIDPCFLIGGDRCYQIPKSDHCCALYYSDLATPLMAYQAVLEIYGKKGLQKKKKKKLF
ncbi:MAG: FAD binding domain-containing protein, partial [Candidatus Asgardarchaeum sp.]